MALRAATMSGYLFASDETGCAIHGREPRTLELSGAKYEEALISTGRIASCHCFAKEDEFDWGSLIALTSSIRDEQNSRSTHAGASRDCVDNKYIREMETAVFNRTLEKCDSLNVTRSWSNPLFISVYCSVLRFVLSNIDSSCYVENHALSLRLSFLVDNKPDNNKTGSVVSPHLRPRDIPFLRAEDALPLLWNDIILRSRERDQYIMNARPNATTDQFKCARCKQRQCSYVEESTNGSNGSSEKSTNESSEKSTKESSEKSSAITEGFDEENVLDSSDVRLSSKSEYGVVAFDEHASADLTDRDFDRLPAMFNEMRERSKKFRKKNDWVSSLIQKRQMEEVALASDAVKSLEVFFQKADKALMQKKKLMFLDRHIQTLRDLRADALNALHSLHFATTTEKQRPSAHDPTRETHTAVFL
eukprot:gene13985-biopygen23076